MAKIILLIIVFFLFSFRLGFTPVHLNQDEAMFALNAKSIADMGKDYYANSFPFYFWHLDNFWATPAVTYWSSVFLKFLPFSENTIRLPSVLLAVINVGLMMYLVNFLFKKKILTLLSGVLLATTPAFFINSRILIDNIYPVTFVLLWLIFFVKNKSFFAGLSLGLGIHSYHAAKIYMPVYFLFSLWKKSRIAFTFGFLIPVILFIPWLRAHPDTLTSQVSYISSIDKNIGANFVGNYLSYFDPALLFTTGDRTLVHSTGRVGVFLFPVALLMLIGAVYAFKERGYFEKLTLLGFLTYPLAPAIINDPGRISRALIVIPFGVLLSTYGVKFLLEQNDKVFKYLLIFVFTSSALLFFGFLSDYFGDYRVRSRIVFNNNIGGAFESILKSTKVRPVEKVYIDKNIFQAKYYFEFYKRKTNIYPTEVVYFDSNKEDFTLFQKGSIVVTGKKIIDSGNFELIEIIRELDGVESYFVYWRDK